MNREKTMEQVMVEVNEVIERSFREFTGTHIDREDIAQLSLMLSDIDTFTQRKFGKSFYDLNCENVDLEFLHSYKDYLLSEVTDTSTETTKNYISSLHIIFILSDAYCIGNMDIDMFESFMGQLEPEGIKFM